MLPRQIGDLASLKRLMADQESRGNHFQFRGWSILLQGGDYIHSAHTEYGITMRRLLITSALTQANGIAQRNQGELVEFWTTPEVTLAIARKKDGEVWWDARVQIQTSTPNTGNSDS